MGRGIDVKTIGRKHQTSYRQILADHVLRLCLTYEYSQSDGRISGIRLLESLLSFCFPPLPIAPTMAFAEAMASERSHARLIFG
jgi:hypothetical protein